MHLTESRICGDLTASTCPLVLTTPPSNLIVEYKCTLLTEGTATEH